MDFLKKHFPTIFLAFLLVTAFFIWYAVFYYEARIGKLLFHVFDVGQGDALFLELSDGNQILIDGGPDKSVLSKLGRAMLPWDRDIDLLILTHPHADHVDGLLEVAKRYTVGAVIESGALHSIPEYAEWRELVRSRGIPVISARAGQRIIGSDGFSLDLLAPFGSENGKSFKNIHDAMIVMKLSYASTSAMLMGDAEQKIEYKLVRRYGGNLRSDVLKVGHHGSKTSTSDAFLEAVSPAYAAISVGRKNRYGHPAQEVLDRLKRAGIRISRTDYDGDSTYVSDGVTFDLQK